MKFKNLKPITLALAAIFGLGILATTPTLAASDACIKDICDSACNASAKAKEYAGCSGSKDISKAIANVLNSIIAVGGIVAVIFIVVGGFKYMTSAGDPGKIESAKKTIIYALVGLIVCALAFAITNIVIGAVNSA